MSSNGEELAKRFCNAETIEESGHIMKDFFKLSFAEQVMFLSYVSGFVQGRTNRVRDMEEFLKLVRCKTCGRWLFGSARV